MSGNSGDGKLNPGSPGFNIDGNTYTYDVGDPDGPQVPQQPTPYSPAVDVTDGFNSNGKKKDLSKGTRIKLSQYLSELTAGKQGSTQRSNTFPVSRSEDLQEVSTSTNDGYPSKVRQSSPDQFEPDPSGDRLRSTSDNYATIGSKIKKGAAPGTLPDGHSLLPSVESQAAASPTRSLPETSPVGGYTSALLKKNRWSSVSPSALSVPQHPDNDINSINMGLTAGSIETVGLKQITEDQRMMVGPALSLRASKEIASYAPASDAAVAGAILPTATQAMVGNVRVDTSSFEIASVLDELSSVQPNTQEFNISSKSWGTLNNVNDRFDGLDTFGMTLLSAALVAGVAVAVDAIRAAFRTISTSRPLTSDPTRDPGRLKKGESSEFSSDDLLINALGLHIPSSGIGYDKALRDGVVYFFGGDPSVGTFAELPKLLLNIVQGQAGIGDRRGFDVVTCRAILRSAIVIKDVAQGVAGQGVVGGSEAILRTIDSIRKSKVFLALNTFVKIGEIWNRYNAAQISTYLNIDAAPNSLRSPIEKSRLLGPDGNTTNKLSWSADRSASRYVVPESLYGSLRTGLITLPDWKTNEGGHTKDSMQVGKLNNYRLSPALAKEIEDKINSEYMPFSFHDVRTNEVIGFHAFIESMSDSFSANYDSTEAFGRVESIKTYKSTNRKISIGFYLVSTGQSDFDEMWRRINKLTTLLYPQFTAGRQLTTEGVTFTQPFTQLPGASPLVRIRLGDVFHSNYTRFALARLFGFGSEGTNLGGGDLASKLIGSMSGSTINQQVVDNILSDKSIPTNAVFKISPGNYSSTDGSFTIRNNDPYFPIYVAKTIDGGKTFSISIAAESDIGPNESKKYEDLYNSDVASVDYKLKTLKFIIPKTSLDPSTYANQKLIGVINPIDLTQEQNFFKPENNVYVKYFEKNTGRGLAGYIESMNFDWYSNVTWETERAKAPKMCKVSIDFSPIHDIAPGIDHMGYNRAPIYPVGGYMKQGG